MKSFYGWLAAIALIASGILFIPSLQHRVGAALRAAMPSSQSTYDLGYSATPQVSGSDVYLIQAVQNALAANPVFTRVDTYIWVIQSYKVSDNGTQAIVVLALVDPSNNERIHIEPLTAVAELVNPGGSTPDWQVYFPGQDGYIAHIVALPTELQDPSMASQLGAAVPAEQATPSSPGQIESTSTFGGYYLPWANGTTQILEQGASHNTCLTQTDCTYAFDFDAYYGQNPKFPIHAAKGGTVYRFYNSCADWPELSHPISIA